MITQVWSRLVLYDPLAVQTSENKIVPKLLIQSIRLCQILLQLVLLNILSPDSRAECEGFL